VKKPSVFCEALFKLLWESAFFTASHQQRQFPQALFSFIFATLFFLRASLSFSTEKFRARIAQERRSATRSTHNSIRRFVPSQAYLLSQGRSPLASDSPTTDVSAASGSAS
jgi:hypothetical protein